MRVLIFLPCFTHGGAEKQGAILAEHLHRRGYDVEVWGFPTLGSGTPLLEELQVKGVRCRELPRWPHFDWEFSKHGVSLRYAAHRFFRWPRQLTRIGETIPSAEFDVVVPFTPTPCLVSVLLGGRIRSRRVFWNHRGGYDNAGRAYTPFLIGQITKRSPVMVANSTAGARFLADTFSLPLGEVSVLRNVFLPDDSLNHLASQRKYQCQSGSPLQLLHVANLFGEKDIWTVLDAMKHLKAFGFPCHLHIAGFFPNPKDQVTFEGRIRAYDIHAMVTFHGTVNRPQLRELLIDADVGLLSSRTEGSPNSVMEYMYARLPVIGTDIPGIREVLSVPNIDWLFPYGKAERLAELIVKLGSDPTTRRILGEANWQRIVADFSPGKLMPKWEAMLSHA